MKIKFFTSIVACLVASIVFSQSSINNYKYVIVPKKFDFQKEKDQYQLNGLTQFLFNKYGFEAVIEGSEYPEDLALNRCLALNSNLIKDPGMFNTKIKVELTDCRDKVLFLSKAGASRQKEYKTAYNLAIREAFKSIDALNYKYEPIANSTTPLQTKGEFSQEIHQLKKEIQNLKQEKQVAVISANSFKQEAIKHVDSKVIDMPNIKSNSLLYAQEITNGFQLVDSTPKVIYNIKNTNLKDVYLVEDKSAVVYKSATTWVIEFYVNGVLKQQLLNIKF